MFSAEERRYLESARVGRLATADEEGRPHAIPVCFALVDGTNDDADEAPDTPPWIATPLDEKPKHASLRELRRVRDVEANPRVALVVDHYVEDWDRLGWLQVRGRASLIESDEEGHGNAVRELRAKYDQYAEHALDDRPLIRIDPGSVVSWGRLEA